MIARMKQPLRDVIPAASPISALFVGINPSLRSAALGHHYAVVHRDHLLRSLVPLYLGRTAAYVQATRTASAEATEQMLEDTALAFERQKPYLVEHWR